MFASRRRERLSIAILTLMICAISAFTTLRPVLTSILKNSTIIMKSSSPSSVYLQALNTSSTGTEEERRLLILDPLIVCGPSGAGKGSIIKKFMNERGGSSRFEFTVSHTTRAPRQGEVPGKDYHFVSVETMQTLVRQDAFLESAQVHGNWYGTSWQAMQAIQSTGKRCLLDIDVQGVQRIKNLSSSFSQTITAKLVQEKEERTTSALIQLTPKFIFIAPPSLDALKERLVGRGSESPETLARRMANAQAELEYGSTLGNFDAIVLNDDLERALIDFENAIEKLYVPPPLL